MIPITIIRNASLCVVSGLMLTVASVIICSIASRIGSFDEDYEPLYRTMDPVLLDSTHPTVIIELYLDRGGMDVTLSRLSEFSDMVNPERLSSGSESLPRWSRPLVDKHKTLDRTRWVSIEARGWPVLATYSIVYPSENIFPSSYEIEGGIVYSRPDSDWASGGGGSTGPSPFPSVIPIYPIWHGMFLNVVFYSCVSGILLWLFSNLLTLWRGSSVLTSR